MSRRPPPGQRTRAGGPPPGARGQAPYRPPVRRQPPPRSSDRTPLVVGGIVLGILVLLVAVYLITSNGNSNANNTTSNNAANAGAPTVPPANSGAAGATAPAATGSDPPRMSLETFKGLYDDPAKRPLIIDVRSADIYAAGHIKGAESFPESDVDARFKELPKDKLIVAYCQ